MNRRRFLEVAGSGAIGLGLDYVGQASQSTILVPSDQPDEFGFRIMWYVPVRPIDPATYRLKIGGLVEKPQSWTLAQLRRFPQESQSSRMKCMQCWSSRATWGGFRFAHLLEAVKPLKHAKAVCVDCADKWYEYMSLEEMLSPRVLMSLDMGGKPLADRHGHRYLSSILQSMATNPPS